MQRNQRDRRYAAAENGENPVHKFSQTRFSELREDARFDKRWAE